MLQRLLLSAAIIAAVLVAAYVFLPGLGQTTRAGSETPAVTQTPIATAMATTPPVSPTVVRTAAVPSFVPTLTPPGLEPEGCDELRERFPGASGCSYCADGSGNLCLTVDFIDNFE
jgi:hypothetical protein